MEPPAPQQQRQQEQQQHESREQQRRTISLRPLLSLNKNSNNNNKHLLECESKKKLRALITMNDANSIKNKSTTTMLTTSRSRAQQRQQHQPLTSSSKNNAVMKMAAINPFEILAVRKKATKTTTMATSTAPTTTFVGCKKRPSSDMLETATTSIPKQSKKMKRHSNGNNDRDNREEKEKEKQELACMSSKAVAVAADNKSNNKSSFSTTVNTAAASVAWEDDNGKVRLFGRSEKQHSLFSIATLKGTVRPGGGGNKQRKRSATGVLLGRGQREEDVAIATAWKSALLEQENKNEVISDRGTDDTAKDEKSARRNKPTTEKEATTKTHSKDVKEARVDSISSLFPSASASSAVGAEVVMTKSAANAALAPIPMPVDDANKPMFLANGKGAKTNSKCTETSKRTRNANNNNNFVRLNLRNKAGSCLGARNKKTKTRAQQKWEERQREWRAMQTQTQQEPSLRRMPLSVASDDGTIMGSGALTPDGIDPVDDLLDGVFTTKSSLSKTEQKKLKSSSSSSSSSSTSIPLCSGHQQPCKQLKVKKASTGNKNRAFYCCALPRGEQCNFFQWLDDSKERVRDALLKNQSYSGFVSRQVQSYLEAVKVLTVPELAHLAQRRGLPKKGTKKELLMRLSLWARQELVQNNPCLHQQEKETTNAAKACITQHEKELALENSRNNDLTTNDGDTEIKTIELTEKTTDRNNYAEDACSDSEASVDDDGGEDDKCSDDSSASSSDEELEFIVADGGKSPPPLIDGKLANKKSNTNKEFSIDGNDGSLESTLKHYFGHASFRDGQEWAIRRCLEHKRTLFVAPTGSGKSLCYALPAALMDGVCIVVSPLLALIQDQIRVMPPSIPVTTLSGSISTHTMAATLDDIHRGRLKIVLVSPEKLTSASFRRLFVPRWNKQTQQYERYFPTVSLLCVDEAHCLSMWAHNFRPSYLRFSTMVDLIRPNSVLAITATAGPRVVADICHSLGIHNHKSTADQEPAESSIFPTLKTDSGVRLTKSDRDNIEVACEVLDTQAQRLDRLVKLLQRPPKQDHRSQGKKLAAGWEGSLSSGSVIVYVWRQRDAEAVAENIQNSPGIEGDVVVYHGGMESDHRATAQSKFIRGKSRICVATVAFGLGINKADVRGVVHMYLSSSPEHYLQEIGRAGRDGRHALAVALILKEEVLVRHSLAHSDMIASSQIAALLSLLQRKAKENVAKLQHVPSQLSVGLEFLESTLACSCKPETTETLVSLLESGASFGKKLLRVDGYFYDSATIAPRRCSLDKLAGKEDVIKALLGCATCVEAAAGEAQTRHHHQAECKDDGIPSWRKPNKMNDHGFGSYRFSISQCANVLGPDAEPRHVFASLRRLQQCGEIDMRLETGNKARALNLRLLEDGMAIFVNSNEGGGDSLLETLGKKLFESFQSTARGSASKVLRLDRILNTVAAFHESEKMTHTNSSSMHHKKSKTLHLFQDQIREYFASDQVEETGNEESDEESDCNVFDPVPAKHELLRVLDAVLLYLKEVERASLGQLCIDNKDISDFAAMAATKFLHGIIPHAAVDLGLCRQHHLFGLFQRTRFSELWKAVVTLLNGSC